MGLELIKKYRNGNDVAGVTLILIYSLPCFFLYPLLKSSTQMNAFNLSFATLLVNTVLWLVLFQVKKWADNRGVEDGEPVEEM